MAQAEPSQLEKGEWKTFEARYRLCHTALVFFITAYESHIYI